MTTRGSTRRHRGTTADAEPRESLVLAPGERRAAIVSAIDSAERELRMAIFRCDDFAVLDAMATALKRGVHLRLLLTSRAKGWKRKLGQLLLVLEQMGAEVRTYADPVVKYHAKYLVADERVAVVTSLNYTQRCFTETCDFLLLTEDPGVVMGLTRLFEADWQSPGSRFPSDLGDRLIVGPEQARSSVTALIEGARRAIQIVDHKLTDPAVLTLLKERQAGGIDVRVRGEVDVAPLRAHGKMLMVDGRLAMIGSMALSALSLGFRREVAVTVERPALLRQLTRYVESLGAKTPARPSVRAGGGRRTG